MESRLATLTVDRNDLTKVSQIHNRPELPSSFQAEAILESIVTLPALFNMLNMRRAIIPAANGHCSARALARYYAALADGGLVPPPHSSSFQPNLGSHDHIPKFPSLKVTRRHRGRRNKGVLSFLRNPYQQIPNRCMDPQDGDCGISATGQNTTGLDCGSSGCTINSSGSRGNGNKHRNSDHHEIFSGKGIYDVFLGAGDYANMALPDGMFGLGFKRSRSKEGSYIGFGHSGMGGSTGFCDMNNRFAMAVTVNKMSFGAATRSIIELVCSELDLPLPQDYAPPTDRGPNTERPLIN